MEGVPNVKGMGWTAVDGVGWMSMAGMLIKPFAHPFVDLVQTSWSFPENCGTIPQTPRDPINVGFRPDARHTQEVKLEI